MMPRRLLLAAALAGTAVAWAQPKPAAPAAPPAPAGAKAAPAAPAAPVPGTAPQPLKGRIKEGLYELTRTIDLSGVSGVPAKDQKGSETRRQCLGKADLEQPMQAGPGCAVKSTKESPAAVEILMQCSDGTATDMRMTFDAAGYGSEMKTTGQQDGKPFVSLFRMKAKYVGPCPAAPATAPAPSAAPAAKATPAPAPAPAPAKK